MRNHVRYVLILAGLFIPLHLFFHSLGTWATGITNPVARHVENLLSLSPAPKVLILGDSHPTYAVDTRQFDQWFNAASPGENAIQTYYKAKHLLDAGLAPPEVVLLPLDPHTRMDYRADRFDPEAIWGRYVDYIDLGLQTGSYLEYFEKFIRGDVFSYAGSANDIITALRMRSLGTKPSEKDGYRKDSSSFASLSPKLRLKTARRKVQRHLTDESSILDEYIAKTVALFRRSGAKPVFIRYPLTSEYLEYANESESEGRDFLLGAPVIDFRRHYQNAQDLFRDADHMNTKGAEIFTRALSRALKDTLR